MGEMRRLHLMEIIGQLFYFERILESRELSKIVCLCVSIIQLPSVLTFL